MEMKELLKKMQRFQGRDEPYFAYHRYQMWHEEPCEFCKITLPPSEVNGWYYHLDKDDKIDIVFCGNCEEKMRSLFEMNYE